MTRHAKTCSAQLRELIPYAGAFKDSKVTDSNPYESPRAIDDVTAQFKLPDRQFLVELAVVIAIITVLVALLSQAVSNARHAARRTRPRPPFTEIELLPERLAGELQP